MARLIQKLRQDPKCCTSMFGSPEGAAGAPNMTTQYFGLGSWTLGKSFSSFLKTGIFFYFYVFFLPGPLHTQDFNPLLNDYMQLFSEIIWSKFLYKHLVLVHNSAHCKYSRTWQQVSWTNLGQPPKLTKKASMSPLGLTWQLQDSVDSPYAFAEETNRKKDCNPLI